MPTIDINVTVDENTMIQAVADKNSLSLNEYVKQQVLFYATDAHNQALMSELIAFFDGKTSAEKQAIIDKLNE